MRRVTSADWLFNRGLPACGRWRDGAALPSKRWFAWTYATSLDVRFGSTSGSCSARRERLSPGPALASLDECATSRTVVTLLAIRENSKGGSQYPSTEEGRENHAASWVSAGQAALTLATEVVNQLKG